MVDAKPGSQPDPNILTYNAPAVAEYYAALNYLTPCEQLLFDAHLKPGMAILDLGVGGGRTTGYLSSLASRYVGVDYASEMIANCRKKFPQLEFHVGDAADLSRLDSASFDAVVMAFNAMDYVFPDEARHRAIQEIHRVLKPEGILIFSSHNPRSICVRPSWNPLRVRTLAQTIAGSRPVFYQPVLRLLTGMRVGLALLQSVSKSLNRSIHKLPTRTFWRGRGFLMDSAHGGLITYFGTPKNIVQELQRTGFQSLRVLGDDYPRVSRLYTTDWYYYVFSKTEGMEEK
jgi:ubiquinone/menaquinone biosynthesis C-methylase UbiE